jgi:hypothetical protein
MFCLKGTYRDWKGARKNHSPWHINHLKEDIERGNWPNAEYWRKVNAYFCETGIEKSQRFPKNP